jgi:hypothetical protein
MSSRFLGRFPEAQPARTWWSRVHGAAEFANLPLAAVLSYPVPGADDLRFFHVLPPSARGGEWRLLTRVVARMPSLELASVRRSGGPDALFPGLPDEVEGEGARYVAQTEDALYAAYPLLLTRWPEKPADALGSQFLEALAQLAPACLLPYYEALNPAFFDWCRGA